ncbi:hypothetical protein E8K88_04410 [Lampropedia aestuarii]|uniref:Uracil-DNA glycosylase-like domain-containing protein n=1 Tax=Lampropedia aestuarii TaxID=2562762 RepID=A0A4S5BVZ4_9BURK|nr:uracil-DNA glycosylase family protein [Lampropedia aestuarii]THJ35245.1 hypothetical protein E8K88_04410 [Lampropedia aestuarii]
MQTLTQSLDPRRLSMLKAMGVELWWIKAAKSVDVAAPALAPAVQEAVKAAPAKAAPAAAFEPGASQPPIAQRAEPVPLVAPPETPGAEAAPVASRAAAPARARVGGLAALAPATSASAPPVLWTMPVPWKVQQENEDASPPALAATASGLLLLVDDLQALGDAQPAAMQLLENMVRAMGLLHSPALRLSWAKRQQHSGAEAATPQQDVPSASVQQLLANASPRAVLVMGRDAAQHWLGRTEPLGVLRQSDHQVHGVPVVVSFSPAYLLRATHAKRQAWADLQRVMALLAPTASS